MRSQRALAFWAQATAVALFAAAALYGCPAHALTTLNVTSNAEMTTANAACLGLDAYQILVAAGTYTTLPNPAVDGTSTNTIVYRAATGVTYSGSVNFQNNYMRLVRGAITGDVRFDTLGTRCVLDSATVAGTTIFIGADNCKILNSVVSKGIAMSGVIKGGVCPTNCYPDHAIHKYAQDDTVQNCTGTFTQNVCTSAIDCVAIFWSRFCLEPAWIANHFDVTIDCTGSAQSFQVREFYWTMNGIFRDNYLKVTNNVGDHPAGCTNGDVKLSFALRDSARFNTFLRDTMWTAAATAPTSMHLISNSGSVDNTFYNSFINCLWWNDDGDAMKSAGNGKGTTVYGCVLGSTAESAYDDNDVFPDSSTFRHNTMVSSGRRPVSNDDATVSGSKFVSNILYSTATDLFDGPCGGQGNSGSIFDAGNTLTDSCLVYYPNDIADSSAAIGGNSGFCNNPIEFDATFRFKSPFFNDSTLAFATFDPGLRSSPVNSWGLGAAWAASPWPDTYVGARGEAPADETAPSTTSTLATSTVTSSTIVLTWTAPGDDGAAGTATSYAIRRAAAVIDDDTKWGNATGVSGSIPTPSVAGTGETMTVTGLSASTTYHFAMKTTDDAANVSALSNSPNGATAAAAGGGARRGRRR